MADGLRVLARLRRMEAELAKRDLAAAVAAEFAAHGALMQARAAAAEEARVSTEGMPGAFGVWLPTAIARISRTHAVLIEANGAREVARQTLADRRAGVKATKTIIETRDSERRQQIARELEQVRGDIRAPERLLPQK